ncbi:UmuC protein [Streptomyces sp. NBRC 110611]|nr:UmuC protein [Streptomyces sp. NBRC 110611]
MTAGVDKAGYAPFAHLTAPNAALCRQVMVAFPVAKERFAVHLRPEAVHAALPHIVTQLRALLVIAAEQEEDGPDAAKAHLALSALTGRFEALAENARAFMGSLQRTIDLHGVEVEVFLAYKDRLIQYLERFIQGLITLGGRIALLIGESEEQGRAGLSAVFVSADGRESQARLLRGRALGAIPQPLAVVRQLNERRAGRSDRSADFRTLARWFAEAPDDEARHRLWRAAFDLHPARHLTVDAETLAGRSARPVAASTPWAEAEPLRISPQLRRTGSYERRGGARKVQDRSEGRQRLAEIAAKQAEEAEEAAAARARLATDGTTRLSALGELDPLTFGLFLRLLGDALATWRPGSTTTVATSNPGSMEIRLTALTDGTTAEIRTPGGVFRGPDHLVEMLLCLALAALERGEAQIALGRLAEQVVLDAADPYLTLDTLIRTRKPELAEWADRLHRDGLVRRLARPPRTRPAPCWSAPPKPCAACPSNPPCPSPPSPPTHSATRESQPC